MVNNRVVAPELNRGGWATLDIQNDGVAILSNPFDCGFGFKRGGTWRIGENASTLTIRFTKRIGYMNATGKAEIDETEVYKIVVLTIRN